MDRNGNYEQMEIDIRLESEKNLKDNVAKVIQFAFKQRNLEAEECGRPIQAVRNKHEGYGIAAEAWSKIQVKEKDIKSGMGDYLALLQVQGEDAIQSCAKLYDGALNLAIESINMAADMNRVLNDLYYGSEDCRTPLEEYADTKDECSNEESVEDGFEEAEPVPAEESDAEDCAENETEEVE